jgi:hypothetical protein
MGNGITYGMKLVPAPDIDICVDQGVFYPASHLIPVSPAEKLTIRVLIARQIELHARLRWGRKGDRRESLVLHRFFDDSCQWGRREWRGWCRSELRWIDNIALAARAIEMRGRLYLQQAVIDPSWNQLALSPALEVGVGTHPIWIQEDKLLDTILC